MSTLRVVCAFPPCFEGVRVVVAAGVVAGVVEVDGVVLAGVLVLLLAAGVAEAFPSVTEFPAAASVTACGEIVTREAGDRLDTTDVAFGKVGVVVTVAGALTTGIVVVSEFEVEDVVVATTGVTAATTGVTAATTGVAAATTGVAAATTGVVTAATGVAAAATGVVTAWAVEETEVFVC